LWRTYAEQICSLSGRLGFKHGFIEFLGYTLELSSGKVYDKIKNMYMANPETLYVLLAHYSKAEPAQKTGELVKFRNLPGGYAYEEAFLERAVHPITKRFGNNPESLVEAAEVLGGVKCQFGDVSVEVPALPMVALTYVLWKGDSELQPSASIFFDLSASHYLPTEDLAVLAELTTKRLMLVSDYRK
jgi:hypothetical protein